MKTASGGLAVGAAHRAHTGKLGTGPPSTKEPHRMQASGAASAGEGESEGIARELSPAPRAGSR